MKIVKLTIVGSLLLVCIVALGITDSQAEVTAYDADGQFLGVLLGKDNVMGGSFNVYMPSVNKLINITVSTAYEHAKIGGEELYFESEDCSGVAYVEPWVSTEIIKNNEKYYTGEESDSINIAANSRLNDWSSVCETFGGTLNLFLVPAQEMTLPLSQPITLPLSFELEPSHPGKWKK